MSLLDQLPKSFEEAKKRALSSDAAGLLDAATTVASSLGASVPAGLRGLLERDTLGGDAAADRVTDFVSSHTYQPRTEKGRQALEGLGLLTEKLHDKYLAPVEDAVLEHAGAAAPGLLTLGAVAPNAVFPEARAGEAVINVGLKVGDKVALSPARVVKELKKIGVDVKAHEVKDSATEPTVIATLSRALTPEEGDKLSKVLKQDAVAQYANGAGALFGPKASEWGPFNSDYFLLPSDQRAPFPHYGEKYPPVPAPELKTDAKTGKEFLGKGSSPETEAFMIARRKAQAEIDAGNYSPYFDPAERFDADPSHYPTAGNTLTDTLPKKQVTIDKHKASIDTPEARANLLAAFNEGLTTGGHDRWYQMGQLEQEFVKELGPEEGRKQFKKRFADAMAATTGGADPTSNLLMAQYGNYLDAHGMPIPGAAYDMPVPIGGRYVTGNMEQYGKLQERGQIPVENEKRHNFSANFTGHTSPSTIDEQMTNIITPGKNAPGGNQYGIYEGLLADIAKEQGVAPRDFQDVAWGGKKSLDTKGKYKGRPMIQIVNEAIERTHRLTGMPKEEIVRRGLVRGQLPLYAAAPVGLLAGYTMGGNQE